MQDERHHVFKKKGTIRRAILILVMMASVLVSNVTAALETEDFEAPSGSGQYDQSGVAPDADSPLRGDILGSDSPADLLNRTPSDSVTSRTEKSTTGETAPRSEDLSEPFLSAVEEPPPVQVDDNPDHIVRNVGLFLLILALVGAGFVVWVRRT
jgi:hypothetical protein